MKHHARHADDDETEVPSLRPDLLTHDNLKLEVAPSQRVPARTTDTKPEYTRGMILHLSMKAGYTEDEMKDILSRYRRSPMNEAKVITDFAEFDVPHHIIEEDHHFHAALKELELHFMPETWHPVGFKQLLKYPWNGASSIELPFCEEPDLLAELRRRFDDKQNYPDMPNPHATMGNALDLIFSRLQSHNHNVKEGVNHFPVGAYPVRAHARSHLVTTDKDDKIRMVFGVPKHLIMKEAQFFWPLQNWLRSQKGTPIAWGYEVQTGGLIRIRAALQNAPRFIRYQTKICLDWKKFDKRVSHWLMRKIYKILQSHIDMSHYIPRSDKPHSDKNRPKAGRHERLTRNYEYMVSQALNSRILLPDSSQWKLAHSGLNSGLFMTQMMGSYVNAVICFTVLMELGIDIRRPNGWYLFQGDDSFIAYNGIIHQKEDLLDNIAAVAARRFGMILNREKSVISEVLEQCSFLGYTFDGLEPIRPSDRLLCQLAYPEYLWNYENQAARSIGIAWASCARDDRLFKLCKLIFEFCKAKNPRPFTGYMSRFLKAMLPDEVVAHIDPTVFPTKEQIRSVLYQYDYAPKSSWPKTFLSLL
jgi:hypothetical protein